MLNIFYLFSSRHTYMCQYQWPLSFKEPIPSTKDSCPFWQSQITQLAHYVGLAQKPYLFSSGSLFTSGKCTIYLTHWFCTAAKNLSNLLFPCTYIKVEKDKAVRADMVRMWSQSMKRTQNRQSMMLLLSVLHPQLHGPFTIQKSTTNCICIHF